jgi:hypothetical protein
LAVVSVAAGVPLEARRVCASSRGQRPRSQGPPPPGALTAPWWQVKPPQAPGGLRGTALGPPFHSSRAQRGTTKTRRHCPSPAATAAPPPTQHGEAPAAFGHPSKWGVLVLGPCFTPTPTPHRPRRLKKLTPPSAPGDNIIVPGPNPMHPPGSVARVNQKTVLATCRGDFKFLWWLTQVPL